VSDAVEPLGGLEDARELWTGLAQRVDNIFSTWDWAEVWWRHYGAGRRLELAVVRPAGRETILPVYAQRHAGVIVRRLVGHGVADQLGPVGDPRDTPAAMRALASNGSDRGVLLAERLAADHDWRRELGWRVIHEDTSPLIDLVQEGSWEGFLEGRSANFRQQARRRAKRMRALDLSFRLADDPDRLGRDFDALVALHRAHWGTASTAFDGRRERFHREFAARALERGWLRLWLAEVRGAPVAAWYGFRFGGVESFYQAGRDLAWDRSSVGAALLEHTIREALSDGMREYRLLRGDESYKRHYARRTTKLVTLTAVRGGAGRAAVAAVRLLSKAPSGRRLLSRFRD